jgi:benzodiazapine receptor
MNNRLLNIIGLGFWILLTFSVAAIASQFKPGEWYMILVKPTWTPPGWLFGPVWGILYLAMSISAWLIWRQRVKLKVHLPLGFYLIQLLLNGLWSWIFFGQRLIGIALIDIVVLWVMIAITIVCFWRISRTASILLMPYLLWVSFAAALNFQIWRMN